MTVGNKKRRGRRKESRIRSENAIGSRWLPNNGEVGRRGATNFLLFFLAAEPLEIRPTRYLHEKKRTRRNGLDRGKGAGAFAR